MCFLDIVFPSERPFLQPEHTSVSVQSAGNRSSRCVPGAGRRVGAVGAEPRPTTAPRLHPSTGRVAQHPNPTLATAGKGLPARDPGTCFKPSALPGLELRVQNLTQEQLSSGNTL